MDWHYNTIWFEQLDPAKVASIKRPQDVPRDFGGLEYVTLWQYKQTNGALDQLPASSSVVYLDLSLGGTKCLRGIGRLPSLRRLEVHRCLKLESDEGLAELAGSLRHLHIDNCRKFKIRGELLALQELEVLRLNQCAELEDLDFLRHFPKLIDFRFVETNVKSGCLAPLLAHPTLRSVGSLNKRHYDMTVEEVEAELERRHPEPYMEYVQKDGRWETFRHVGAEL